MGKIQTFTIDSENSKTDLCKLGYATDKSPHNLIFHFHKHPYTPIYSFLFGPYRNKIIQFCEIGVAGGYSIEMWRNYFNIHSAIVAMDYDINLLDNVTKRNLHNVFCMKIDVSNEDILEEKFKNMGVQFDIILDDSDHCFESHIKIVKKLAKYVKPGGMLIIEDVNRSDSAEKYEEALGETLLIPFESVYYVKAEHKNKFSGNYNNDTLLVFVKS